MELNNDFYLSLFNLYYADQEKLKEKVLTHSRQVANKAIEIIDNRQLPVNREFVYYGAMFHDIGVFRCNAPDIHAFGPLPYICHGVEGHDLLLKHGLPEFAGICERHTGSGITLSQIVENNLPLPHREMVPQTLEEMLICYADKFYSKSGDLLKEKPLDKIIRQMEAHGADSLKRFLELHSRFS